MLKAKNKLLILFLIVMLLFSTLCFATNDTGEPINENARTTSPTGEGGTAQTPEDGNTTVEGNGDGTSSDGENNSTVNPEDIYDNNLTIFDNDIKMDKMVDGNVYLFGNNIEITGQVNGNLFVFGNNVKFADESYIINSVYVFANTLDFRGLCSDLNVVANKVNIPYSTESCFVFRDLNVFAANSFTFAGGVGRNANIYASVFNFVKDENASGLVYGNLNYSSTKELELSDNLVQGSVNYNKFEEPVAPTMQEIIMDKIISLGSTLLYVVIIYLLALLVAPKFVNKSDAKLFKLLPAFGIGILSFIAIIILFMFLMFTVIGVPLGFVMICTYALLFSIAFSIFAIYVSNVLKDKVKIKIDTKWKFILLLLVVALIMWLLQQVPYINGFITAIILISGIGLFFLHIFGNLKKVDTTTTPSTL